MICAPPFESLLDDNHLSVVLRRPERSRWTARVYPHHDPGHSFTATDPSLRVAVERAVRQYNRSRRA